LIQSKSAQRYWLLALFSTLLAVTVVMLGAYARLKDAGLGCPDWPGCYGQLTVPQTSAALAKAQMAYPKLKIEPQKAWPEMIHRYFAGTLGLLILTLAIGALWRKRRNRLAPLAVPLFLVGMVIFQAMLGMWTVTWQLLPQVVMGHLLGGMTIAAFLWWLTLSLRTNRLYSTPKSWLKPAAVVGIAIVALQIFLGGWTSANYASIICPDFPFCQGSLFPKMDFATAFNFTSPIGANYQGGLLGTTARVTLQMMHRYGAMITATYITILAIILLRSQHRAELRTAGWGILSVLTVQFLLGIANIDTKLALPVAVAHNGVALILLLSLVTLAHLLFKGDRRDKLSTC
jgi:cytochrome c oxidase assembly protein subunit 15